MVFLSHSSYGMPGLAPLMNVFILRAARLSSKLLRQGYVMERFEIVPQEVLWLIWGSHQTL